MRVGATPAIAVIGVVRNTYPGAGFLLRENRHGGVNVEGKQGGGSAGDDYSLSRPNASVCNPPIRTFPSNHQYEAFKRAKSTSDAISGLCRRSGKGKQKRVFLLRPSTPQNINTIHNLTTGPLTSLPDCGGSSFLSVWLHAHFKYV